MCLLQKNVKYVCSEYIEDVDVFFEGKTVGLFALSHLKNELERLLGCSVDIVRLREHMNAALHKRIEKEGLYV